MLPPHFPSLFVLLLVVASETVRLIREQGFKPGTHFYHVGDGSYAYHFNTDTASSIYFKCALYEKLRCHGRAILRRGGGFRHSNPHNHPADPDFVGMRHFRQNVLNAVNERARYVSYQEIVDEARRDQRYSKRVRMRMTVNRLRTAMYKKRMKKYPPIPYTLQDLTRVLLRHPNITRTVDGEENLYAGSITALDGSHHVAFFSPRMLKHLERVKVIQGDGTFRARPQFPQSSQCFVIVTTWNDCVVPMGWVLMERRTFEAYKAVFHLIKQICPNLNPDVIISDWEREQQRAWSEAFPNAEIQGCLWHLGRAFVRKAKELRILRYCKLIPETVNIMRKLAAIALLPEFLFEHALGLVKTSAQRDSPIAAMILWPFFDYVEEKWLKKPYRREWMSFYNAIHRTNNSCETHNKMLRSAVGPYRPNIYNFIEAIARLEHNADLDVELMKQGEKAKKARRWTSVYMDRNIEALNKDLALDIFHDMDETIMNFLEKASTLLCGEFKEHVEREENDN